MLGANPSRSAHRNPNLTLLAFKPRQVLLSELNSNATAMAKQSIGKTKTLNADRKALLLHSVLRYLESNGFSKALKRLLSEAQIKSENWKACSLNLEDMYCNYLEACAPADTDVDSYRKEELLTGGATKKDGESLSSAFEQTIGKKKKKRNDGDEGNVAANQSVTADKIDKNAKKSRDTSENDLLTDSNVELKEEKKQKNGSNSLCQTEQGSLKEPAADGVCEVQKDKSTKKPKDSKKKKSKSMSESLDGCNTNSEAEGKSNDGKEKKQITDPLAENIEQCKSAMEASIPLEEKKVKSKDKKRKKQDSVSKTLSVDEVPRKEDPVISESKKESFQTSEDATDKEKKSSKKRKRLASDENEGQRVEKLASDESKRRKTESLEENKSCEQPTTLNAITGKNEPAGNGAIKENGFASEMRTNGGFEKDGEKSGRKQPNGSAEPKSVNAFQRVKVEEVKFVDDRLKDNSYWAKDGAEIGYGAKAQEVLGQVRGRDFRHEKTKKKRGSYRGGQIDLHSHSVKFNYSDEE